VDDADPAAWQQELQQFLEVTHAGRHLGAGGTCAARVGTHRPKLGQQRSQTARDHRCGQGRHVCAGALDLCDDAAARVQPRAAPGTSDVDA
jgi:hypothetical protein